MARVCFTENLQRHLDCPAIEVEAQTVREAIDGACESVPRLKSYILDEHGAVRKHVAVFVDAVAINDRTALSDAITPTSEIYVMQALSGG